MSKAPQPPSDIFVSTMRIPGTPPPLILHSISILSLISPTSSDTKLTLMLIIFNGTFPSTSASELMSTGVLCPVFSTLITDVDIATDDGADESSANGVNEPFAGVVGANDPAHPPFANPKPPPFALEIKEGEGIVVAAWFVPSSGPGSLKMANPPLALPPPVHDLDESEQTRTRRVWFSQLVVASYQLSFHASDEEPDGSKKICSLDWDVVEANIGVEMLRGVWLVAVDKEDEAGVGGWREVIASAALGFCDDPRVLEVGVLVDVQVAKLDEQCRDYTFHLRPS
ncbi:hypothetical protein NP233_g11016 [Leucocoprinus birnbaumii]|uniref:Uncharacterized protein n=1 Tax=Leucocoprinus birnbaumii TaxID=56174 RepID=A0AAD5VHB1_9AGAR|nr:hypothetical protein NP233_g11016 [Leucocoprinus birnbaumii]